MEVSTRAILRLADAEQSCDITLSVSVLPAVASQAAAPPVSIAYEGCTAHAGLANIATKRGKYDINVIDLN
jgi:hypothetical protein